MTIAASSPQSYRDGATVANLVACLKRAAGKINDEDKVLSRWNLEVLLDELAAAVSRYLTSTLPEAGQIGCSIVYGVLPSSYYVGGASRDRRKMEFEARYYRLEDHWLTSFTSFSISAEAEFVLDDFDAACLGLKDAGLTHVSKDCETPAAKTKSYCCIPIPRNATAPSTRFIHSAADLVRLRKSNKELDACMTQRVLPGTVEPVDGGPSVTNYACGALRFTSENPGNASRLRSMLDEIVWEKTLLEDLGQLVRSGVSKAGGSDKETVLLKVLADFFQELSEWRGSEFYAINQLTLMLQCMFDACEVSVFEAHRESREERERRCDPSTCRHHCAQRQFTARRLS